MSYWPEISFRYTNNDPNPEKEKAKVNIHTKQTNNGDVENFARCTQVLLKFDSSLAEKALTTSSNMSTTHQNSSTVSRNYNTREHSWAEDFIDLTEFCQPSTTTPIKMEHSVDERSSSPNTYTYTNAAGAYGYDNGMPMNDLEQTIDDKLWCMPSPSAMQEEYCDPMVSDWLAVAEDANNPSRSAKCNNDTLSSRTEISYDIDDVLLDSRPPPAVVLDSVPSYQHKKTLSNLMVDKAAAQQRVVHQQCPQSCESSSFRSQNIFSDSASFLSENMMIITPERSINLPSPANSQFANKHTQSSCSLNRQNQLLEAAVPSLACDRIPVTAVDPLPSSSSCMQQPSVAICRSHVKVTTSAHRRRSKSTADINETVAPSSACPTLRTSEMLQSLVNKETDFDLVSYVFEENKSDNRLNGSSRRSSATAAQNVADILDTSSSHSAVTIKTEPEEDSDDALMSKSPYNKHKLEDDDDDQSLGGKRLRRYSTCSSEDLTQLESEKYRELRNKNNEASRRSRANRKTREVEMKDHALQLESENIKLKVKAEEMEKLVKKLRNCLMQLVLNRR